MALVFYIKRNLREYRLLFIIMDLCNKNAGDQVNTIWIFPVTAYVACVSRSFSTLTKVTFYLELGPFPLGSRSLSAWIKFLFYLDHGRFLLGSRFFAT